MIMKRTRIAAAVIGFWGVLASETRAQDVRDFTTRQPTSQELVETLRPQTRGITPVADIAALHVTFAFNSAEITPESLPLLRNLGEALKSNELGTSCMQ